jgi:hypothetical protein
MLKFIFVLVVGISIGYFYGFSDAKKNEVTVVERVVDRVGGSNRGKYRTDIDKQMDAAERR